jgi:VWFA-related protein
VTLFLSRLKAEDEVFLSVFNHVPSLLVPWTRNHDAVTQRLDSIRPHGSTAVYRAILFAVPILSRGQNRKKVLLLVSDDMDNDAPYKQTDGPFISIEQFQFQQGSRSASSLQRSEALLYAVGIGTRTGAVNLPLLRGLADPTAGYAERVLASADLAGAVARVADDLRAQYLLGFEPLHQPDGKFHKIILTTTHAEQRVRTRAGYVAEVQVQP